MTPTLVIGGAWLTGPRRGRLSEGRPFEPSREEPQLPRAREVFSRPLPRYGRFDAYTRLGLAAFALALNDAGWPGAPPEGVTVGIITASRNDCLATDLAYWETARDDGGALASPNLFSYTLPGVLHGEAAAHFGLTGPTFCLDQPARAPLGARALDWALRVLEHGAADAMLAGWVEAPAPGPASAGQPPAGAIAMLLATTEQPDGVSQLIRRDGSGKLWVGKREIAGLADLFGAA